MVVKEWITWYEDEAKGMAYSLYSIDAQED